MKVKGLDGKTYTWKFRSRVPDNRSQYHILARTLLRNLYPLERIVEEVFLPGSNGLTVDFYIPTRKLFIEVHGEQHYKYIPHFHQTKMGFFESLKRDKCKRQWADINKLKYVELPYNECEQRWYARICEEQTGMVGKKT